MRTGIFLPCFSGERLRDFPAALAGILEQDNVRYYDGVYTTDSGETYLQPVPEQLLLQVHTPAMLTRLRVTGHFDAARYSAGGVVQAAEEIRRGRIDNAFVFTGWGDHHAGRDFFGGMCYLNGAALAIAALRASGMARFAIVDTDSHHADGTRDIFRRDSDVLHICFCSSEYRDEHDNIDVGIPARTTDAAYLALFRSTLRRELPAFRPEVIFWEFGYDGTVREYGDRGLSPEAHVRMAALLREEADTLCGGRLLAILCGGSSRALAACIIPSIIRILAQPEQLAP